MIMQPLFLKERDTTNTGYLIIVFLFWPLIGLLLACTDIKKKLNRRIIMAFMVLYGLMLFINPLMDSERRASHLKEVRLQPFDNLFDSFNNMYEETLDVVEITIMFVVSRVTDFHGVLFAVYAFLFGGFMLYYLSKMYGHYATNQNVNTLLLFILLVCANPINNINGFRMWMAAWVFAVGVLNYLHDNRNYLSVLMAASAVLIHFSYLPALGILALYIIFKNKAFIYGIIAITTFSLAELNIQELKTYAAFLGTASETKLKAYTNEEHMERVLENSSQAAWYIDLINNGIKYFILISLLLIYLKTRGSFKKKITANLYSFSLLFLSFANVSSLLPSGGRFYVVFYIFAFSAVLLYYVYDFEEKGITVINRIGMPIVALYAIFAFRLFSDSASCYLLAPSFMMPLAFYENVSLQSLIF